MKRISETELGRMERDHGDGITSAALLKFFAEHEIRFGTATLRKWVQLGLLPRSVRVGQKGKHLGSKGLYPVRVVRQILRIKEMMARNLTIEEIQRQFLFVRGDIEALEQTLDRIFAALERTVRERSDEMGVRALGAEIGRARALADDLVDRLEQVERKLLVYAGDERHEVMAS
ncbi:MAG: hypothetical protein IT373_32935 [Polyangiaceae bacterium]|nr:hypothetical protein [Polyangiaceae bacterium]